MRSIVCTMGTVLFYAAMLGHIETSNAYLAYSDLQSETLKTYQCGRKERALIYEDKTVLPPRFCAVSEYPVCFHASQFLTWSSDIIADGIPVELLCFHACGGEVTFTALEPALDLFDMRGALSPADFSKTFHVGGEDCVPIRELCDMLGFEITYNLRYDTIYINTH